MTDSELADHLRELFHVLDEALNAVAGNPAKARASIREAQEGIDEAVYQLVLRVEGGGTEH